MKYASIDIGTNTILMLIGEIAENSIHSPLLPKITPIEDFYEVPRLGKNVSVTKKLDHDSIERALVVLRHYKEIAEAYKVDRVIASATSAVRDAINRKDFIDRARDDVGIEVELISGDLEAEIGFMAATSGASEPDKPTLVVDIGGGSTELSYGTASKLDLAKSINIGAVRITEKFFHNNPPNADELNKASEFIRTALNQFPFDDIKPGVTFGVAGTATTLALIAQGRYEFDVKAVTNYIISVKKLVEIFDQIKVMTTNEILKLTKAAEGRADVLVAGALILMKVLEASKASEFLTTDRGLRYGYMLYKHRNSFAR
jgi:exopolyphosphatase / guanosine-5'-triphosphate,3'-diphosphate pyrophosphatase